MYSDLVDHFPQYQGKKQDCEEGMDFITKLYHKAFYDNNEIVSNQKRLYTFYTCATDTQNIWTIYCQCLKETFFNRHIDELCNNLV